MDVQELVGLVPWTFVAQICNLFIQVYLIKRFLFKPVNEMLEKRKALADAQIREAEKAKADADAALPFADVTAQRGYIAIAYEIGMTTGATETTFEPDGTAAREQAAACSCVSTKSTTRPRRGSTPSTRSRPTRSSSRPSSSTPSASAGAT